MSAFSHLAILLYGVGYGTFVGVSIEGGQVSKNGWFPVLAVNLLWPLIFVLGTLEGAVGGGDTL